MSFQFVLLYIQHAVKWTDIGMFFCSCLAYGQINASIESENRLISRLHGDHLHRDRTVNMWIQDDVPETADVEQFLVFLIVGRTHHRLLTRPLPTNSVQMRIDSATAFFVYHMHAR